MPEGLVSLIGESKVQDFIMPGNRLADVDTVSHTTLAMRNHQIGPLI